MMHKRSWAGARQVAAAAVLWMLASLGAATPAAAAVGQALPLYPAGSATTGTVTLYWLRANGASSYQIQIRDSLDVIVFTKTVSAASIGCTGGRRICRLPVPQEIRGAAGHRWRVRGTGGGGQGPWSDYASFVVSGPTLRASTIANTALTPQTATTITSVEVNAPAPGAFLLIPNGALQCVQDATAEAIGAFTFITDDPGANISASGLNAFGITVPAKESIAASMTSAAIMQVRTAGAYTFYWRGVISTGSPEFCQVGAASINALYVPYGGPPPMPAGMSR
jgi:hypothetical protein